MEMVLWNKYSLLIRLKVSEIVKYTIINIYIIFLFIYVYTQQKYTNTLKILENPSNVKLELLYFFLRLANLLKK